MDLPSTLSRTITAPPPTTRRPSNFVFAENKSSTSPPPAPPPLSSHSHSIDVPFSNLSLQSPTTPTTKYAHRASNSFAEQHHPFFSPSQLAGIRPLCSLTEINDWTFLTIEKYPTLHNA
ncbi:hypothetical protein BD560DRAFT_401247 [Blakeslea trispora]|nr:hypothetical protein BD560DRAFT_401247 [Blakeslea trispora]